MLKQKSGGRNIDFKVKLFEDCLSKLNRENMGIADTFRRFFKLPPEEPPDNRIFPSIVIPLATLDETGVTSCSNATIIDAQRGLLVTAKHSVLPEQKITVKAGDWWYYARLIKAHPTIDIALLRTDAWFAADTPKLEWAAKTHTKERVRISGWLGDDSDADKWNQKLIRGKINGDLDWDGWPVKSELTREDCVLGMSGSPAINDRNQLIGIFVSRGINWFGPLRAVYVAPIWFAKECI